MKILLILMALTFILLAGCTHYDWMCQGPDKNTFYVGETTTFLIFSSSEVCEYRASEKEEREGQKGQLVFIADRLPSEWCVVKKYK